MPPSFVEEAGITLTSVPSTSARDLEPASKPAARSRQATRKQQSTAWKQQTSGGTVTGLAGIALVVCGYFGWRWYQRWKENSHTTRGSGDASTSQPAGSKKKMRPGDKGYASSFSFDGGKKGGRKGAASQEPVSAVQAIPQKSHSPTSKPGPSKPSGNPKKNKSVKQAKKEAKKAKEREERESKNVASLIASRAKAKGIAESGQPVDTGLVTVVDYEKTNDAYHSVMNWQETGRKQFK